MSHNNTEQNYRIHFKGNNYEIQQSEEDHRRCFLIYENKAVLSFWLLENTHSLAEKYVVVIDIPYGKDFHADLLDTVTMNSVGNNVIHDAITPDFLKSIFAEEQSSKNPKYYVLNYSRIPESTIASVMEELLERTSENYLKVYDIFMKDGKIHKVSALSEYDARHHAGLKDAEIKEVRISHYGYVF